MMEHPAAWQWRLLPRGWRWVALRQCLLGWVTPLAMQHLVRTVAALLLRPWKLHANAEKRLAGSTACGRMLLRRERGARADN